MHCSQKWHQFVYVSPGRIQTRILSNEKEGEQMQVLQVKATGALQ